jgi:hypothetical protein
MLATPASSKRRCIPCCGLMSQLNHSGRPCLTISTNYALRLRSESSVLCCYVVAHCTVMPGISREDDVDHLVLCNQRGSKHCAASVSASKAQKGGLLFPLTGRRNKVQIPPTEVLCSVWRIVVHTSFAQVCGCKQVRHIILGGIRATELRHVAQSSVRRSVQRGGHV